MWKADKWYSNYSCQTKARKKCLENVAGTWAEYRFELRFIMLQ